VVKEEETLILLAVLNEKLTINSFKAIRKVTKEFHEGIKPIKYQYHLPTNEELL